LKIVPGWGPAAAVGQQSNLKHNIGFGQTSQSKSLDEKLLTVVALK
jgi:hypothetical protein